jgi:putative (di)nucleoside polyphosphate hydrolase
MTEPAPPELPLRPAVGIALFGPDGGVFMGRRVRGQIGTWQMPQGGIDEGEEPLEAAMRELAEETGIVEVRLLAELPEWLTYDLPPDTDPMPRWASRYRGQSQRWFAMRFLGEETSIDLATGRPEFDAWRWVPLAETPDLVVPFKRPVYERVVEAFAPFARPPREPDRGSAPPSRQSGVRRPPGSAGRRPDPRARRRPSRP